MLLLTLKYTRKNYVLTITSSRNFPSHIKTKHSKNLSFKFLKTKQDVAEVSKCIVRSSEILVKVQYTINIVKIGN